MLTDEQRATRKKGIGGSDAAAIAGLSPWKTPLDVYLEKTEDDTPQDESPAMYWGTVLEDVVAQEYAKQTGNKIRRANRIITHPYHHFIIGSLDRQIVATADGPGVLECKTAGRLTPEWGDAGTDQIPEHYLIQCAQYMAVTGYRWAHLAVLFMADRLFRIYKIQADNDLNDWLIEIEIRFWTQHVQPRVPPQPQSLADVGKRYPKSLSKRVIASPDLVDDCMILRELKTQMKSTETLKEEIETRIKTAMEDAAELVDPNGLPLATWKSQTASRIDTKALRSLYPDIAVEVTKNTESRVFRLRAQQ